jgi:hypothetical protein
VPAEMVHVLPPELSPELGALLEPSRRACTRSLAGRSARATRSS